MPVPTYRIQDTQLCTSVYRCGKLELNSQMFFYIYSQLYLNLNSVNQLIYVMVKCGVLFEVRTEFLNNI
jgi:hypothetical protein